MITFAPRFSIATPLAAVAAAMLLAAAAALAWIAGAALAGGYSFAVFLTALAAGLLAGAAGLLAVLCAGLLWLRYTVDRNAVVVRWLGIRQVIPLARITRAERVADLAPPDRPLWGRRVRWPGLWAGASSRSAPGPVVGYATAPPRDQVLLATSAATYLLAPRDPAAFLAALAARQALGPTQALPEGSVPAAWAGHPLLRDRRAAGLLIAGLLLNLGLFAYLAWTLPGLPASLALHWNPQGDPDRIGQATELLTLPVIALGLWGANLVLGGVLHVRARAAALLLYGGAGVVQIVFWAAVLTIVVRALAGG